MRNIDDRKLTEKTMKCETNIKVLDKALKKISTHIDGVLYEVEVQTFFGPVYQWYFKIKGVIPNLQNIDSDDDGHPIRQFNCPPFIEALMQADNVGIKFGKAWRYTVSSVIEIEKCKYIEYIVGKKYESIINLLIVLKISGRDVEEILKDVIFEALNKRYEVNINSIELAGVNNIVNNCVNILNSQDNRLVNRHILLAGPPGCGKSEIVKMLIKKTPDWIHYTLSNDINDWGEFMRNLNKIMNYIGKKVMILVDEIDEIASSRENANSQVYDLLRVMDGINDTGNIKFVSTTNRPKVLDPALKRIGRFGPIIVMDKPSDEVFIKIIDFYAKRYKATDIDKKKIVSMRNGAVGSEIRAAFENCLIHNKTITTELLIQNLKDLEESKHMAYQDYV